VTANKGKLAIITGASTGIGYELAKCCAESGFDLCPKFNARATLNGKAIGSNA
jgi:short-subunit dehydrogenase